jgi:hypothetical protein
MNLRGLSDIIYASERRTILKVEYFELCALRSPMKLKKSSELKYDN